MKQKRFGFSSSKLVRNTDHSVYIHVKGDQNKVIIFFLIQDTFQQDNFIIETLNENSESPQNVIIKFGAELRTENARKNDEHQLAYLILYFKPGPDVMN